MEGFHLGNFINALIYSLLGIAIFGISFWISDRMTPYDLWKEIVENKNVALAIMVGAMSIGVCIIIAAAVH